MAQLNNGGFPKARPLGRNTPASKRFIPPLPQKSGVSAIRSRGDAILAGLSVKHPTNTGRFDPRITTLMVSPPSASIADAATLDLTAVAYDQDGKPITVVQNTVSWTTSNAAVATVDANGLVTAVDPGTCEIICTRGKKVARATITVTA